MDLRSLAEEITTSFEAFCRICLTLKCRNWRVMPQFSKVIDKPFILTAHQLEFYHYLEREDISDKVILKTRQRGYSTVTIAYILWKMLYSYNENMIYCIDKGDKAEEMAAMFTQMFHSIPPIFRPAGIEFRKQPNRVFNIRRNNRLVIKTATFDTGRSGTHTRIICDEFASYELSVQEGISASITSSCPKNRVWISTPKQEDDIYHRKVREAEANGTLWKHSYWEHIDDWFGSRELASAWRIEGEKGLTPAQIARELDCKFKGAVEDLIWVTEPTMYRPYRRVHGARAIVALDLGYADDTAILFARDYGKVLHVFEEHICNQTTIPEVAGIIRNKNYQLKYGIMDSSGKKVDQTSGVSSHKKMERLLACRFYTKKLPDKIEMLRIANTALLEGRIFIDQDYCPQLTQMFNNYEWDCDKIPHNKYSHLHDAFVYLVYNWVKMPSKPVELKHVLKSRIGL